jgi:molybdopterin molybdotransferase
MAGRLHFVRVTLVREGERFVARSTGNQSSGVLSSLALAQGLLVFPAEATELAAGCVAEVQVLDADVLAAPGPP